MHASSQRFAVASLLYMAVARWFNAHHNAQHLALYGYYVVKPPTSKVYIYWWIYFWFWNASCMRYSRTAVGCTRVACSLYRCALSCTADCSRNILNLVSENFVLLLNLVLGFSKTPLFLTWVAFTLTRAKRFYFGSWIHSQARANVNATHAQKRSFRKFQLDPTKLSTYSCMYTDTTAVYTR